MQPISNIERARAEASRDLWLSPGNEGLAHDIDAGLADDCEAVQRALAKIEGRSEGREEDRPSMILMVSAAILGVLAAIGIVAVFAVVGGLM